MPSWNRGYTQTSHRYGGRGGWNTRGNIYSHSNIASVSVRMRDVEVQHALRHLDGVMDEVIQDVIRERMNIIKNEIVGQLESMGTGSTTPQGGPGPHQKIADSIKIADNPEAIRIFSAPYPGGVKGSRGVKLAQLFMDGAGPFMYGFDPERKPPKIVSSGNWLRVSGKPRDIFLVKKNPIHPGFGPYEGGDRETWDWIEYAEEEIQDNFVDDLQEIILRRFGA